MSIGAIGSIDKKLVYRERKGFSDVKKYTETINPGLPGQAVQKGYFKDAIEEWKEGGYSAGDVQAWNLYARANRKRVSGFNMFTKFKIGADVESKTWERLTNCSIYDVTGAGFKVDINVAGDYTGRMYYGTSKLYMVNEVPGVFSVNKYTFEVTGLSVLTNYYFYIKNTAIGKEGRTGIYGQKTTLYTPVIIEMGSPAIDRPNSFGVYTVIDLNNPANASGKITSVEIWATTGMNNCEVATFFLVSGSNYSTRDTHTIGSVTAGSKQTFSGLDIDVVAGDFIGIYYSQGSIDRHFTGYNGVTYAGGDKIPCTNQYFELKAGDCISLRGIGLA